MTDMKYRKLEMVMAVLRALVALFTFTFGPPGGTWSSMPGVNVRSELLSVVRPSDAITPSPFVAFGSVVCVLAARLAARDLGVGKPIAELRGGGN